MPQRDYKIKTLIKKRPRGTDPLWTRAAFIAAHDARVKPPYESLTIIITNGNTDKDSEMSFHFFFFFLL